MLWIVAIVSTGVVAGKMADIEGRSAIVWGVSTAVSAWFLGDLLGQWYFLAPIAALAACFAGLWYAKDRDERRGGRGGKITR